MIKSRFCLKINNKIDSKRLQMFNQRLDLDRFCNFAARNVTPIDYDTQKTF